VIAISIPSFQKTNETVVSDSLFVDPLLVFASFADGRAKSNHSNFGGGIFGGVVRL
jgi:hypothetical protein